MLNIIKFILKGLIINVGYGGDKKKIFFRFSLLFILSLGYIIEF